MPNNKRKTTTKEQVSEELRKVYIEVGYINETLINKHCSFSRRAVRTHFGSISAACLELGLRQESAKAPSRKGLPRHIYTKEEAILVIKSIEEKHGYFSKGLIDVNGQEYGQINHKVITRIWKTFENMYIELDVQQRPSTKDKKLVSDEEYLLIINNYIKENNITEFNSAILNDICNKYFITYQIICKRFGPTIEEVAKTLNLLYIKKWQSEETALDFVAKYLNDYYFIKQYRNINIKNNETNMMFRIDGFWPNHRLCVEYNGQQHYKFVKHFHKDGEGFKKGQHRDILKYQQIQDLNLKLLIIKYNDSEQDVLNKLNILFPNQTSN